jgi:hypothetical protein
MLRWPIYSPDRTPLHLRELRMHQLPRRTRVYYGVLFLKIERALRSNDTALAVGILCPGVYHSVLTVKSHER